MEISATDLAPNGPPSEIGFQVFERELESRDLSDLIEIRNYNDGDIHSKALLIDDGFVVIGSQNLSDCAWDDGALLENNFGVEDLQAMNDFKKMFEIHREHTIPR